MQTLLDVVKAVEKFQYEPFAAAAASELGGSVAADQEANLKKLTMISDATAASLKTALKEGGILVQGCEGGDLVSTLNANAGEGWRALNNAFDQDARRASGVQRGDEAGRPAEGRGQGARERAFPHDRSFSQGLADPGRRPRREQRLRRHAHGLRRLPVLQSHPCGDEDLRRRGHGVVDRARARLAEPRPRPRARASQTTAMRAAWTT